MLQAATPIDNIPPSPENKDVVVWLRIHQTALLSYLVYIIKT